MPGNPKQKQKLLHIADYIKDYSDIDNPVSVEDIIAYLETQDIDCERKSVYNDIKVLIEYGMQIERTTTPKRGYYVKKTGFELCELIMLLDAVRGSPAISKSRTRSITDKILQNATAKQAEQLKQRNASGIGGIENLVKSDNEEFFRNLDKINTAIASGQKVRFIYHHRVMMNNLPVFDMGREFIISPYAVIWSDDRYYVVGNYDKYDDLSHYRMDRMKRVEFYQEAARPLSEVSNYKHGFNFDDYTRSISNMYAGTSCELVELECDMNLLDDIVERFGLNIPYRQFGSYKFTVKVRVAVNDGFERWLLNYGGGIIVRSPQTLCDSLKKRLLEMADQY